MSRWMFDFAICFLALPPKHSCLLTSAAYSYDDTWLSGDLACAQTLAFACFPTLFLKMVETPESNGMIGDTGN